MIFLIVFFNSIVFTADATERGISSRKESETSRTHIPGNYPSIAPIYNETAIGPTNESSYGEERIDSVSLEEMTLEQLQKINLQGSETNSMRPDENLSENPQQTEQMIGGTSVMQNIIVNQIFYAQDPTKTLHMLLEVAILKVENEYKEKTPTQIPNAEYNTLSKNITFHNEILGDFSRLVRGELEGEEVYSNQDARGGYHLCTSSDSDRGSVDIRDKGTDHTQHEVHKNPSSKVQHQVTNRTGGVKDTTSISDPIPSSYIPHDDKENKTTPYDSKSGNVGDGNDDRPENYTDLIAY